MGGQPWTAAALVYELKAAGDPQVSPDGSRIAYTLAQIDPQTKKPSSSIWLCKIDGSEKRRLTHCGKNNANARWSPDGTRIAFASHRVEPAGIYAHKATT